MTVTSWHYNFLRLQLLQARLLLQCEKERQYVRDEFGRFANAANTKISELTPQDVVNNCISGFEQFDKTKRAAYEAFDVRSPAIMDATLMKGITSPNPVQNALFGGAKVITGKPGSELISIAKGMDEKEIAVLIQNSQNIIDSIPAKVAAGIGAEYLNYKKDLDRMRNLEKGGETEWVGQMGRMGAFGIEAAQSALILGGATVLPEAFAAESSMATITPKLQKAIEKKVVVKELLQTPNRINQSLGDVMGETPSNMLMGLTAGATVGGAINDAAKSLDANPEPIKQAFVDYGINYSADKAKNFCESMGVALVDSGAMDKLKDINIDPDEIVDTLQNAYDKLPPGQQEIAQILTGGEFQ